MRKALKRRPLKRRRRKYWLRVAKRSVSRQLSVWKSGHCGRWVAQAKAMLAIERLGGGNLLQALGRLSAGKKDQPYNCVPRQ